MNHRHLEGAVARVDGEDGTTAERQRRAYLLQSIMVSKYIVAQLPRKRGSVTSHVTTLTTCVEEHGGHALDPLPDPRHSLPCRPANADVSKTLNKSTHTMVYGCKHYKRKCSLVAPCCNKVVACRFCHDETSDHQMDRYAVKCMVCNLCGREQDVAGSCAHCGEQMARYYCDICHLFDDEEERSIYHC